MRIKENELMEKSDFREKWLGLAFQEIVEPWERTHVVEKCYSIKMKTNFNISDDSKRNIEKEYIANSDSLRSCSHCITFRPHILKLMTIFCL